MVRTGSNEEAEDGHDIVGGTVFFFSRDQNRQKFDWLFVDEAGQVSLANMVAMGAGARGTSCWSATRASCRR